MAPWVRIEDLDDRWQYQLFKSSEMVYKELSPPDEAEPFEHMSDYIGDVQTARKSGRTPEPEDYYYVYPVDNRAGGVLFFSVYRKPALAFISYMGLSDRVHNIARQSALEEMVKVVVTESRDAQCSAVLFELEKVDPCHLVLRAKPRGALQEWQRNVRKRILITSLFQKRHGARKMMWVRYRQPKLEWNRPQTEIPMHLMIVPTSGACDDLPRKVARHYLRFVYMTFYRDGYEATEPEHTWPCWKDYLRGLTRYASNNLPARVPLRKIDIHARHGKVFISYADEDHERAYTVAEYLEALGIRAFCWSKDCRVLVGKRTAEEIRRELDGSKYYIVILTQHSYKAKGQHKELAHMQKKGYWRKKRVLVLKARIDLRRFSRCAAASRGLGSEGSLNSERLEKDLRGIVFRKFRRQSFLQAVADVSDQILKCEPDVRRRRAQT